MVVPFDEQRFVRHFTRLFQRLLTFEEHKHMPPKHSFALKDLALHYGVFEKMDVSLLSNTSSNVSLLNNSLILNESKPPPTSLDVLTQRYN